MQKFYKPICRLIALALTMILVLPAVALAKPKKPAVPPAPVKVTILATAGVNGHIINWNYELPKTADFGLVKIASLVKKERQSNFNTLLLDCGNMLSGSALTDYFATTPSKMTNPMVAMYNYLGYDAVVLGKGELAYGPDYLSNALSAAKFPVLSANARPAGKSWPTIKPYTIKEIIVGKDKKKEKIRIGIIGASAINPDTALPPNTGFTFIDQDNAINATIKSIQKSVDAIIIVKNDGLVVSGVAAATPGKFGSSLSKTELTFEKSGKKWVHTGTDTSNIFSVMAPPDRALEDAAWPYHDATLQHLAKRP